jgi:hypothetical protein
VIGLFELFGNFAFGGCRGETSLLSQFGQVQVGENGPYAHLPIYKWSMDLTIYFETIVRNFTRYHKCTLGSQLREKRREIVGLIIKTNFTVEKLPGEENGDRQLFSKRESSLSTCR